MATEITSTAVTTDSLKYQSPYVPTTSTSPGLKGQKAWDEYFDYTCIEDNVWARVSHSIEW